MTLMTPASEAAYPHVLQFPPQLPHIVVVLGARVATPGPPKCSFHMPMTGKRKKRTVRKAAAKGAARKTKKRKAAKKKGGRKKAKK